MKKTTYLPILSLFVALCGCNSDDNLGISEHEIDNPSNGKSIITFDPITITNGDATRSVFREAGTATNGAWQFEFEVGDSFLVAHDDWGRDTKMQFSRWEYIDYQGKMAIENKDEYTKPTDGSASTPINWYVYYPAGKNKEFGTTQKDKFSSRYIDLTKQDEYFQDCDKKPNPNLYAIIGKKTVYNNDVNFKCELFAQTYILVMINLREQPVNIYLKTIDGDNYVTGIRYPDQLADKEKLNQFIPVTVKDSEVSDLPTVRICQIPAGGTRYIIVPIAANGNEYLICEDGGYNIRKVNAAANLTATSFYTTAVQGCTFRGTANGVDWVEFNSGNNTKKKWCINDRQSMISRSEITKNENEVKHGIASNLYKWELATAQDFDDLLANNTHGFENESDSINHKFYFKIETKYKPNSISDQWQSEVHKVYFSTDGYRISYTGQSTSEVQFDKGKCYYWSYKDSNKNEIGIYEYKFSNENSTAVTGAYTTYEDLQNKLSQTQNCCFTLRMVLKQ